MTLWEFLLKSQEIDLLAPNDSRVAHIREHVQNIDVLALQDIRDMYYEDIRDIFIAIMLDSTRIYAVTHGDAWKKFANEATRLEFTQSEIDTIEKRSKYNN